MRARLHACLRPCLRACPRTCLHASPRTRAAGGDGDSDELRKILGTHLAGDLDLAAACDKLATERGAQPRAPSDLPMCVLNGADELVAEGVVGLEEGVTGGHKV